MLENRQTEHRRHHKLKLMLCEETMTAEEIEKLDLFNVSDIKILKNSKSKDDEIIDSKALKALED